MQGYQRRIENALEKWLPAETHPRPLSAAMCYATLGGGKRVRPLLVYATGTALGVESERLDGPACAVELIHAYSLIHDDLPAMDNDDFRRGRPSCHKAFGEAMAILAGDALQALAFEVLARDPNIVSDPARRLQMIQQLSEAAGAHGMVGGQAIELALLGKQVTLDELDNIHLSKTGALIRASVRLGALSQPAADDSVLQDLDEYARCVGLAFQILDDILDVQGDSQVAGSGQHFSDNSIKSTYPSLLGLEGARQCALSLHQKALTNLSRLDERADPLRWLSTYIVERTS
jgi:farnesyl diphosphate synthase